jgi:hypothetical protein
MNILSKIFYIIFWSIVFSNVSVSAFNQKLLAILNASNLKPESQRLIAYNFDGTKVVSNNHKKREGQVVNAQPKNNEQPKNSIKKIFEENDGTLNVVVELVDDKSEVKISVFNMLGKEVKKIYQGLPSEKNDDGYYVFDSQTPLNLPKNVYILVVQGNTFKIADRFIIAR